MEDLGIVISVAGAICAVVIIFIFPAVAYLRVCKHDDAPRSMKQAWGKRACARAMVVFGVVAAPTASYLTLTGAAGGAVAN